MTGLRKAMEDGKRERSKSEKQSHTFPFSKIVYVGDLSGEASYGLRYAQKLAHEQQAELVLVHSLDPIVYALPRADLDDVAAQAELTAMEHTPSAMAPTMNLLCSASKSVPRSWEKRDGTLRVSSFLARWVEQPPAAWPSLPWRGYYCRIRPVPF